LKETEGSNFAGANLLSNPFGLGFASGACGHSFFICFHYFFIGPFAHPLVHFKSPYPQAIFFYMKWRAGQSAFHCTIHILTSQSKTSGSGSGFAQLHLMHDGVSRNEREGGGLTNANDDATVKSEMTKKRRE
jgi:hypothetical protein